MLGAQIALHSILFDRGGVAQPPNSKLTHVFTQPHMDTARFAKLILM
jgi:hypothetical protein